MSSVLVSVIESPTANSFVTLSFFAPLIQTSIFEFVNVLVSKYLSVTEKSIVAVLAGAFTVALSFWIYGSTTSTTVADVPAFDVCATNLPSTYKYIFIPSYTPLIFVFFPSVSASVAFIEIYLSICLLYSSNAGFPLYKYIPNPPICQFPSTSALPDFISSIIIVVSKVT